MTEKAADLIRAAAQSLHIKDIVLYTSTLSRPAPMPSGAHKEATQQNKQSTKYVVNEPDAEDGEGNSDLIVMVDLGVRLTDPEEDDDPTVYVQIEAKFLVEYVMSQDLDEEAIKAFAKNNSVHNVWPFWRQHVYDIVQRAELPQIDVPLFSVKNF